MRYVEVAHTALRNAYDHALDQLKPIDLIEAPALSTSLTSLPAPTSEEIPTLIRALISRIESVRRDATTQQQRKKLHRFVKRIRRIKDDLETIL